MKTPPEREQAADRGSGRLDNEPANPGAIILFRRDGSTAAEYVNRAMDGWIYHLGWSPYIDQTKGEFILRNLRKVRCNA